MSEIIKKEHCKKHNKISYKYSFIGHLIFIGMSILFYIIAYFIKDFTNFAFGLVFIKVFYFLLSAFQKIRDTVYNNVSETKFLIIIFWSIILVIGSFSTDFVFLFYTSQDSFTGINPHNIITVFVDCIFLSTSIFLNIGFSNIIPASIPSKILVTLEMVLSFIFLFGIISNFFSFQNEISSKKIDENIKKKYNFLVK